MRDDEKTVGPKALGWSEQDSISFGVEVARAAGYQLAADRRGCEWFDLAQDHSILDLMDEAEWRGIVESTVRALPGLTFSVTRDEDGPAVPLGELARLASLVLMQHIAGEGGEA